MTVIQCDTRERESETGSETGAACERAQSEDCVLKDLLVRLFVMYSSDPNHPE